jgi:hypothetical protein
MNMNRHEGGKEESRSKEVSTRREVDSDSMHTVEEGEAQLFTLQTSRYEFMTNN